jgi:organic hydroperoxide reductase OsmC/OhrA
VAELTECSRAHLQPVQANKRSGFKGAHGKWPPEQMIGRVVIEEQLRY